MNISLNQLQEELNRLLPAPVDPLSTASSDTASLPPALPCQLTEVKTKGYHLDAKVTPGQVVAVVELLNERGFAIDTVTGVDWMAAGEMEVVYDFYHMSAPWHAVVRTRVPRTNPEVPTVSGVFPGANWHERETHEFFGIRFAGHPNLRPLLLPEDATYHPLRKDFTGAD
jgi:NADH-quinone oxidoreductase subunit C